MVIDFNGLHKIFIGEVIKAIIDELNEEYNHEVDEIISSPKLVVVEAFKNGYIRANVYNEDNEEIVWDDLLISWENVFDRLK